MVEAVHVLFPDIFQVVLSEIYLVCLNLFGKNTEALPVQFRLEAEV